MKFINKLCCLVFLLLNTVVLHAQDNHWEVNIYDYQYDMTVYASLVENGVEITDYSDYEVAAFIDNECRGIGVAQEESGNHWLYLRVRSNTPSGETISFKLYKKSTDKESYLSTDSPVTFTATEHIGYPTSPITLTQTTVYSISVSSTDPDKGTARVVNFENEAPANSTVTIEATPNTGYSFDKWNSGTDNIIENPYSFTITDDVAFVASFKANQYTITFDTDGGSTIAPITQDYNTAVTAPTDPTKTGHEFAGWDKPIPATMPAENITIKALWTIKQYTITFDTDGGSAIDPITQDYNTSVTAPADPTKTGYEFAGWDKPIPATMPAENITIKALWTINQYLVTFIADEVVVYQERLNYGSPITAPQAPAKEGYTFSSWGSVDETVPAHDVTYTAVYTANTYELKYVLDGEEYAKFSVTYGTAITPLDAPVKEGYTFSGWSEIPETMPGHDVEITGSFTVNKYKLTYKVDGEVYSENEVTYGTTITPLAAPTKEGYTFSGWSEIPATMPARDVEVMGTFTINKYKLTYMVDGIQHQQEEITFGEAITPLDPVTREGYTFSGWSEIPATMPAHDVTVTGSFTINKYKLTYKVDNEIYSEAELAYGTTITPLAAPAKEGHTFSGWSEIPATMPAKDVEVTGSFTVNKYKLTYMVDGEVYQQEEVAFGAAITPIAEPTREEQTFSGWSHIPETMPAHDVTVTGTFSVNAYLLTYRVDGEIYNQQHVEYGAAITPLDAPTKEGYTFSGWSEIPETMPGHDVEVTGSFTVNKYKLTYKVDGEVYSETEVAYGTAITPLAAPAKEGHTFSGWSEIPATMPAHAVTVTGSFTINKYKLTYKVDGEVYSETEVTYGTTITPLAAPTKEGYTFSGWSEIPATMPAKDVEVTGSFTVNKYKLTYMVDGEIYQQEEVAFGTAITPIAEPTREEQTFSGWSHIPETMPAHDVTVTGTFSVNAYLLTYRVDGEIYNQQHVEYGAAITPLDAPTKEGYSFSGWSEIPETMPGHDVEITGSFTVNKYKLTYKVDGEVYSETEVAYGTAITPISVPAKEGYTFSGWSAIPETMPAHDVEVTGSFTVNTYKLIYMLDGEVYQQDEVAFGTAITPIAEPAEREGYTFSGWSEIPATMPAHDVVVTGSFTVNKYKLTYKVDNEVYDETEVAYGAAITPLASPTKEGHTFSGWSEIPATMPAHDVEVTGSFTVNTYKLTYKVDNEVYSETEVAYGTAITPLASPTKEGHTFSGWSEIPATMPAHDVEVNGYFSVNSYTLTFSLDGSIYMGYPSVEYGTAIIAPEVATDENVTFLGWENMPETMPAHDLNIVGHLQYSTTPVNDGVVMTDESLEEFTILFDTPISDVTDIAWAGIYLRSDYEALGKNATPLMVSVDPELWQVEGTKVTIGMGWNTNPVQRNVMDLNHINMNSADDMAENGEYVFILEYGSLLFANGSTNVTITEDVDQAIENEADAIDKVVTSKNTEAAYDLSGRRMNIDRASVSMPRIMIVNGRKVVVGKKMQ